MEQAATVSVGNSTTTLKKITVTFPQPFATVPVVVANTQQTDPSYPPGSIPDTFAVSITGVSKTGFTANIYRVDTTTPGWGQKLSLGYAATTP
jgi:H-type lectin domain